MIHQELYLHIEADMTDDIYAFTKYVDTQIKLLQGGNYADLRPTNEAEIETLQKRCEQLYEAGQAVIRSLSENELVHCRQVFLIQQDERRCDERQPPDEFCEMQLEGEKIIACRYLLALPVTRKFSQVLTS